MSIVRELSKKSDYIDWEEVNILKRQVRTLRSQIQIEKKIKEEAADQWRVNMRDKAEFYNVIFFCAAQISAAKLLHEQMHKL